MKREEIINGLGIALKQYKDLHPKGKHNTSSFRKATKLKETLVNNKPTHEEATAQLHRFLTGFTGNEGKTSMKTLIRAKLGLPKPHSISYGSAALAFAGAGVCSAALAAGMEYSGSTDHGA